MNKAGYCLRSWGAIWVSKCVFYSIPIYSHEMMNGIVDAKIL